MVCVQGEYGWYVFGVWMAANISSQASRPTINTAPPPLSLSSPPPIHIHYFDPAPVSGERGFRVARRETFMETDAVLCL